MHLLYTWITELVELITVWLWEIWVTIPSNLFFTIQFCLSFPSGTPIVHMLDIFILPPQVSEVLFIFFFSDLYYLCPSDLCLVVCPHQDFLLLSPFFQAHFSPVIFLTYFRHLFSCWDLWYLAPDEHIFPSLSIIIQYPLKIRLLIPTLDHLKVIFFFL